MYRGTTVLSLALLVSAGAASAVPFTGDVPADFASAIYVEVFDSPMLIDVGLPSQAPPGTISGWDMLSVLFHYDEGSGDLSVGIDFAAICGDADGDGDEAGGAPWFTGDPIFGYDVPQLGMTEAVCVAFDFDQDGSYDLVAGIGNMDGTYRVAQFSGSPFLPAGAFGALLPQHDGGYFYAGTALAPDFELRLADISGLLTFEQNTACFDFLAFAGSYQDDGIGEDYLSGTVCFEGGTVEAFLQPADFGLAAAYPNPFNPATTLGFTLPETGIATLAVYNLQGQQIRSLMNGLQPAGYQQLSFDAGGLPSGLYIAALRQGALVSTTRLVLTK
jgi:hypothetical protein